MDTHTYKTLFKYREWNDNGFRAIVENEIYIPSPKDFNDPFDCRISTRFLNQDEGFWKQFRAIWEKDQRLSQENLDHIIEEMKKDPLTAQEQIDGDLFRENDKYLGILCFSTEWDIIKLWSHYAAKHQGFCIGYDLDLLISLLSNPTHKKVKYTETHPEVTLELAYGDNHSELTDVISFHKSSSWEEEKEYRITTVIGMPGTLKSRVLNVPNEAITEITLGINCSRIHEEGIKSICAEKGIKLFKAKKVNFKFEVCRDEVKI